MSTTSFCWERLLKNKRFLSKIANLLNKGFKIEILFSMTCSIMRDIKLFYIENISDYKFSWTYFDHSLVSNHV